MIRKARFGVYPSEWYEKYPSSVMESQMYGTPVLGARIGDIPDLIKEGKTGELFESDNGIELQEKIEKLCNNRDIASAYAETCKNVSFGSA